MAEENPILEAYDNGLKEDALQASRMLSGLIWEHYDALCQKGFSDEQALALTINFQEHMFTLFMMINQ